MDYATHEHTPPVDGYWFDGYSHFAASFITAPRRIGFSVQKRFSLRSQFRNRDILVMPTLVDDIVKQRIAI